MDKDKRSVFITGGTGYMGMPLALQLVRHGHEVRALVRPGSQGKLPSGCTAVTGDALDADSYSEHVRAADTFVQLVGVSHPNPSKAAEFRRIDLASATGAVRASVKAGVRHFVYVSVAQPAPVMKAYVEVRAQCENIIRESGLNATILRPWYVLGPGHRWPYALWPLYWLMGRIPATREGSRRLGLITLDQMTRALLHAIENPARGIRIVEVPELRASSGFWQS